MFYKCFRSKTTLSKSTFWWFKVPILLSLFINFKCRNFNKNGISTCSCFCYCSQNCWGMEQFTLKSLTDMWQKHQCSRVLEVFLYDMGIYENVNVSWGKRAPHYWKVPVGCMLTWRMFQNLKKNIWFGKL